MNKFSIIAVGLFYSAILTAQVGIGTQVPNVHALLELKSSGKGLLLPRMTEAERSAMNLSAVDAGMMIYQTSPSKGIYLFDGSSWTGYSANLLANATGATLRWNDNSKSWESNTNLFNQGTSVGINTLNPKSQLHINTAGLPTCQLQLTNPTTGPLTLDGLIMGVLPDGSAQLTEQENKHLLFATNSTERVRIDSIGRMGINTSNPSATLDVNGSFKLGSDGTPLQSIMRMDFETDPPEIAAFAEWACNIPCPTATTSAVVYVSPGANMDHIILGYSRVNAVGNIQVKLMNMSTSPINLGTLMLHIAVIQ